MTTYITLHEPDDYLHYFGEDLYIAFCSGWLPLTKLIDNYLRYGVPSGHSLTTNRILRVFEEFMPRKGRNNGNAISTRNYDTQPQSSGNEWKWANIALTDEDIEYLNGCDSTLEFLAGCVAALASDGYGVTIKPVDSGKSICCTIYRPDFPGRGITVGVSSFADTVRDALMVGLYKFDEKLGGDFANISRIDAPDNKKPRFR